MKLSVFTVMLPDLTPAEAVTALSDNGYHGVEWRVTRVPRQRQAEAPSFWGNNLCTLAPTADEARRARSLAESAGLQIPSLGTYIEVGDTEAVATAMRFAQIAGAPQIRVGVGRTGQGSYAQLFESTRDFLGEVEKLAFRFGVKAIIETHHGTIAASASAAFRLVESFDPVAIGVIYDPGNMVFEGYEDYQLGLELLGPYLAHVHLKNAAWQRPSAGGLWHAVWSPLENGVVDFPRLLQALKEVGYQGWLGLEDFSNARPTPLALAHNIDFVRRLIE